MKIVLATGIYPPDIGGPATYVKHLADELSKSHTVEIVTYGAPRKGVHSVALGLPIARWFSYAKQLKQVAKDADVVYAFSSISCGVPLILSGVKKPKKVLRLGGDFFWERYTDHGGRKSLREWYGAGLQVSKFVMGWILKHFDHIVFSTAFQQEIYMRAYKRLPKNSVIQNALTFDGPFEKNRQLHKPFRLLFMGRFVRFKNIEALIAAMMHISDATLTIVGEGPLDDKLRSLTEKLKLTSRVRFVGPVHGADKAEVFTKHDLLVLPSLTEISPNTALEARAAGLPVLLTNQHGLSELAAGMTVAPLTNVTDIVSGVKHAREMSATNYSAMKSRQWSQVASETQSLFDTLKTP